MQARPLPPFRRVVTAIGGDGLSFIQEDGSPQAVHTHPGRPGYVNANIWRTKERGDVRAPDDIQEHMGVMPPANGTVLRIVDFPPQPSDPQENARQLKASFDSMYRDAKHQPGNRRHPGMHVTATVDYAIVLLGEITAIMETGETVLRAGDVLIQRGTNHAWANRSEAVTRVAFVLIDAPGAG